MWSGIQIVVVVVVVSGDASLFYQHISSWVWQ